MTLACLSDVSLNDTAWAFNRFLCLKTRDLGGHDLAGGLGGGLNTVVNILTVFLRRFYKNICTFLKLTFFGTNVGRIL